MTLVNDRRDADESVTLPGASTETVNDPIGSAEPDGGRPGPELDEARTAPVAIIPTASTSAGPSTAPSDSAFQLRNLLRAGLITPAVNGLAVIGLLVGVLLHAPVAGLVVVAIAVLSPLATPGNLAGLRSGLGPTGVNPFPRVLLAVLTALVIAPPVGAVATAVLLAGAGLLEPVASRISTAAGPYSANVPGIAVRNDGALPVRTLFLVNAPAALLAALAASLGLWPVSLVLGAVALAATVACGGDAATRVVARRRAEHRIAGAIADLRPAFALHWDAPPGTEYQVTMWLPYLERIGTPFVIVVRNPKAFAGIAAVTTAPVVVRPQPRDLDAVVAPSLRAVFYVNNAARNTHLIRFTGLLHVQLNHGESDKAPSYSPVFRLYDRDFVAGQAAIDRFARNGVHMPADLFRIVGRPQIEQIVVGASTTEVKTALYAPTWGGSNSDSDYCSLPIGVAIVESLLRRGYTVVFRPHPYTDKDPNHAREAARIVDLLAADSRTTGRRHRFGAASGRSMSITDCFNAADVMVSDVSSVVPDFLYSEKPFAIAAMQGSVHSFKQSFPIAEAGYVLDRKGRNIDHVLDAMTGADPIREARKASKRYFLGDFPAESYAEGFLEAAREVVLPPR